MIRLRNAALAAVASLLATGALAQAFIQDSQPALVAEELFGSGEVKLEFKPFGDEDDAFVPKAKLIFSSAATSGALGAETEFMVTYTLSNATFAERASLGDFMWGRWGPSLGDDCATGGTDENADDATMLAFCTTDAIRNEVTITIEDGGAKGDSSVTYNVKVGATAIDFATALTPPDLTTDPPGTDYTGETRKIVWAVPDLNATGLLQPYPAFRLPYGRDVTVSTAIERATSAGTNISESLMGGNTCGSYMPAGVLPTTTVSCPVVEAMALVSVSAANGGGGMISLNPDDGRAVLVDGDGDAVDPQRAHIATVTVGEATEGAFGMDVRDEDGDVIDEFSGALSGNLAIHVASEGLRDGDMVYIDANGNKMIDGREAFEIDGAMALDTVALADKGGTMHVFYVPNGKDPLKHRTSFSTTAKTEFGDTSNRERNSGRVPAMASLDLVGIKASTAKAYAIAPLGSTDVANVRVTCESSAPAGCNVFLDCKDPAGMVTFGDAGAMIGPGMTVRWNQMQIAEALGLDDGWEGRLACEVLSSAEITVQVLTRAAGVLVNNTATDSGGT